MVGNLTQLKVGYLVIDLNRFFSVVAPVQFKS